MQSSKEPLEVLVITHGEASIPPKFTLTRLPDGKSLTPVPVASPYNFLVEAQPNSNLMREMHWYLEHFLDYPFHPETVHADHVLDALKAWGSQAFNALFDRRDAGEWLSKSDILQIRSDDAQVLSWPWEALFDPQAGTYLALRYRIERRLNNLADPPALGNLPNDRVNILMVVARPYERDVRYRSIARPLVELIHSGHLPAHVDILRPPTFDQLRQHLRAHPNYYHLVHFDLHGAYGDDAGNEHNSRHRYQGREGRLIFENSVGEPAPKSARDLSVLLHEHAVPCVILNACQAAMLDEHAEDAFASVATALLQSGMRSVVAMTYSLCVSGAQVFLPAFYGRLFETGSVAEATLAGRQQMLSNKKRISARGPFPLEDWLLPVLYQQVPVDFGFARQSKVEVLESRLPKDVQEHRDEYGFIGRDGPILDMERALHRQAPCILIQGLGGVGKTTLAHGFLRWLDQTGGLEDALWFDFREIRTAESVINKIGQGFYGGNFGIAPNKLELLARAMEKVRVLMVWDNFESTAHNLPAEDRAELSRFLDAIRGTRGKVIMTSRSHPELKELMDQLRGHPLAMRAVLPRLERMMAAKVAEALRNNLAELGLDEEEELRGLFATLRFVEQGLAEELRSLLSLVGLHESYLDAYLMEQMAKQVNPDWTRARIDQLMAALAAAGIVREIANAIYEMHPLLTSYLRAQDMAPESCQRAFVDVMGSLADELTVRPLHEQRIPFMMDGANFYFALELSAKLGMNQYYGALMQSTAVYAQGTRDFVEASRLFQQLAQHSASIGNSDGEASAYHQLGMIAVEQRDFVTAREWCLKSLAIKERQGNEHDAASTYHQLGDIALVQRDFATAQERYLKSLAVFERQGNEQAVASTYHQLGVVAEEQRDFATARKWYLKSLAIEERQGNEHGAASTYHNLGNVALEQRDFATAREWSLKSLAIEERQRNEHGAAGSYHQLGMIAQQQGDFATARECYLKSLAIEERQLDEYGAAIDYHQLGRIAGALGDFAMARDWYLKSLAITERLGCNQAAATTCMQLGVSEGMQANFDQSGRWLVRATRLFVSASDRHGAGQSVENFLFAYQQASEEDKQKLRAIWAEAGIGPLPEAQRSNMTMPVADDETVIHIVKIITQSRLQLASGDQDPTSALTSTELRAALVAAFGDIQETTCSEGDLARAAFDLLAQDSTYAEPIRVMARHASAAGLSERYLDPTSIALTTAALLVMQTRIKFKIDNTGKWSLDVDKKSASDSTLKLLVQRLLSFLNK